MLGSIFRKVAAWVGVGMLCLFCLLAVGCGIPQAKVTAPDEGGGYDVVDTKGTVVHIPAKPERILAGILAYDTMLLGLTTPDHLVAVNMLDRDPLASFVSEDVKEVKLTTTTLTGLTLEMVVKSHPDVIIVPDWTSQNDIDMFRSLGYPVVVGRGPQSIADVRTDLTLLGKVLQEEERSDRVIAEMDRQLAEIETTLSARQDPWPVGLLVSQMRSWGGPGSIYDEITNLAHVQNGIAVAGLKNGEELTKEMVLKSNPDFFLISASKHPGFTKFQQEWFNDPALQHMKGIHHLIPVPNRYLYCASQDIPYAVKAIANAGYGPIFDMSDEHNIRGY